MRLVIAHSYLIYIILIYNDKINFINILPRQLPPNETDVIRGRWPSLDKWSCDHRKGTQVRN
jgi:hypothetical protein